MKPVDFVGALVGGACMIGILIGLAALSMYIAGLLPTPLLQLVSRRTANMMIFAVICLLIPALANFAVVPLALFLKKRKAVNKM